MKVWYLIDWRIQISQTGEGGGRGVLAADNP